RGVVANGVGLRDLTRSPDSYGVQYFAGENASGYFVSTFNGDKKVVPATFLFPAMVWNSSDLTFTPPRPGANFSVAGLYCRVLCDGATASGVQAWLESSAVLKEGQTIKGKRFEFGGLPISGSMEQQLFTRFSRTYVPPAQGPSTPSRGPRYQPGTPSSRMQGQNIPGSPYRSSGQKPEAPRPFTFANGTAAPFIPVYDCRNDTFELKDLTLNAPVLLKVQPGDIVLISTCI
ncbi:hypothetical protein HDU77_000721, partial [Chytriomyces hyalinus]